MSISQNFPEEGPTLNLNFAGSKILDPRITFSRSSVGTYMDDSGLIVTAPADAPRFDHRYVNGEIESLGLLVEEQRTNLTENSETLSDYSNQRVSNNTISTGGPFGTGYHEKTITEVGGQYNFHTSNQISITAGQTITFSIFFKNINIDANEIYLRFWTGTGRAWTTQRQVRYNLTNLTTTVSTGTIVNSSIQPFPDDWYRLSMTATADQDGFAADSFLTSENSIGEKYQLMGAQVEVGTFPTSYIPTSGSTATRNHDRAVIEGSNFTDIFNTNFNNFSMFVNYDNTDTDDGTNYSIIQFWGESTNFDNRIGIFRNDASPYHIETRAFGGGSAIFSNGLLNASSKAATQKLATSWSVDYSTSSGASRRWAFSFNGESVDVVNDGTGTTIPSLTRIGFGKNPTRTDGFGGKIHFKQISLYSNTLTDSQLQNLTK